jgi:hypothetical protein
MKTVKSTKVRLSSAKIEKLLTLLSTGVDISGDRSTRRLFKKALRVIEKAAGRSPLQMSVDGIKVTAKQFFMIEKIAELVLSNDTTDLTEEFWNVQVCGDRSNAATLGSLVKKGLVVRNGDLSRLSDKAIKLYVSSRNG